MVALLTVKTVKIRHCKNFRNRFIVTGKPKSVVLTCSEELTVTSHTRLSHRTTQMNLVCIATIQRRCSCIYYLEGVTQIKHSFNIATLQSV